MEVPGAGSREEDGALALSQCTALEERCIYLPLRPEKNQLQSILMKNKQKLLQLLFLQLFSRKELHLVSAVKQFLSLPPSVYKV